MGFLTFKFGINFATWYNPLDFIVTVFCWPFADDVYKEERRREKARMAHERRMAQQGLECTTCKNWTCEECKARHQDIPETVEAMAKVIEQLRDKK